MTPTGRRTPHGEDGFALIEVLVSALILAIVAAGVMAVLQATTRSAADERRHAQGFALAQEDQARLRSMRLSALNRLDEERDVTLEGSVYHVISKGVFVNNSSSQPASCSSGETSADYVRITSTVDWDSLGSRNPIVMQSIVSPSNGSLDPSHGTLVVTTKNAAGEPIAGVGLSATGTGTFTGTTDSTGCANFTDLPAGNYEVVPNAPGLVDKHGDSAAGQPTSVIAGGTNTLPLEFDEGATLPVEFRYRVGSSSEFKAAAIDSVFVFNTLMNPAKAYWSPSKARVSSITATPIFPFTSPDSVYAGACEKNNPTSGEGIASVTLQPGETHSPILTLNVPALEMTVTDGSSTINGAEITITDEKCEVEGKDLVRSFTSESKGHQSNGEYGLPYSTYELCASAYYESKYHRRRESGVSVKSYTSTTKKTLSLPSSGYETGSNRKCP